MTAEDIDVSVIVPVRDEAGAIGGVIDEIAAALAGVMFEIIVVDDGSDDDTWSIVAARAAEAGGRVRAVRLRRKCGKSMALQAGLDAARGVKVVLCDGDGQDVPAEMPRLLRALDDGARRGLDLVGGRRTSRRDHAGKRASSWLFNTVVSLVTGVHMRDHNTGLKAARREVFDEVPLSGDLHRFLFVLAHHRGFRVGELDVAHRARAAGRSKYGALRGAGALADLVAVRAQLAFEGRRHRWLALGGAGAMAGGACALALLAFTWLAQRASPSADYVPLMDRPLLPYAAAALLFGAQTMAVAYVVAVVGARDRPRPPVAARAGDAGAVDEKAARAQRAARAAAAVSADDGQGDQGRSASSRRSV